MRYRASRCPIRCSAWYCEGQDTSINMSTLPSSIAHLKIPIICLNREAGSSLHSLVTSNSGAYPGGNGPACSLLLPFSSRPSPARRSLIVSTDAFTYSSLSILHALTELSGMFNRSTPAPRYSLGGPYSLFWLQISSNSFH